MASPLPPLLDFVQIAHPSFKVALKRLKEFYSSSGWWNYQPVMGAFPDIVAKAISAGMARSTCDFRGVVEGRPHNSKVAEIIFETFKGQDVRASRVPARIEYSLRNDLRILIKPVALLEIASRQSIAFLAPRVEPLSASETAFYHWVCKASLDLTNFSGLPIEIYFADRASRQNGICTIVRGAEIQELTDEWCLDAQSTFLRAFDYLDEHPEERPVRKERVFDDKQIKLL